jgi:hypothetical protein
MFLTGTLLVAIVLLWTNGAFARDAAPIDLKKRSIDVDAQSAGAPKDKMPALRAATAETTWLGTWNFDGAGGGCDPQGWVSVDITEQIDAFFHVDDFAGLGGGGTGLLYPLEGGQSLWCGARPAATGPVCGYATLPGYGNNWAQMFCTSACLAVDSLVTIDYLIAWDSEPGYDATTIEVDACDDAWQTVYGGLGVLDGTGAPTFLSNAVPHDLNTGQLRFRFKFLSDGAWSDEDGLWATDGAVIVDSLSVSDQNGVVLAVEDFEGESVGDTQADGWEACNEPGYGDSAALLLGGSVVQQDPCRTNLTCFWAFFSGSTYDYSCGGFASQAVVPYENPRGQYIHNEIWSPVVPWTGAGTTAELAFDVYRELPLNPLIFFVWHARSYVGGCAGKWKDFGFVYYGAGPDWVRSVFPIGSFIETGATDVQVAIGVRDMCFYWCGMYGDGQCHSHSPLIDNVAVYRINTRGPVWTVRDLDLFQDNFATDGTITGSVPADIALNTNNWASSHNIIPGDSAFVGVNDPDYGLAPDLYTGNGSAVYCFVTVSPPGQPGKSGAGLVDDSARWPVVDSLSNGGVTWYQIKCDSILTGGGYYTPVDRFCVDLNDNLFTPGDTVWFFFKAHSAAPSTDVTYWSLHSGTTGDLNEVIANPMEFTCLPAGGYLRGGDILYCDNFDGRGAQPYFDTAFQMLGIDGLVDRYDKRGPSSAEGNSIGGRVIDVYQQLLPCYRKIIWNSGDLSAGPIGDGEANPEYADDAAVLYTFLNNLPGPGGLYISGDDVAEELAGLYGSSAVQLRSYINYSLTNASHFNAGLGVSPLAVGAPGSIFAHAFGPDSLIAYGGCPLINDFDVISPTGMATLQMSYRGSGNTGGAVVAQSTSNAMGADVGVVLSGFSFHYIRDTRPTGVPMRAEHLGDIITWLGNVLDDPVGVSSTAFSNSLSQNYPNPFNPTTTIEFVVRENAPVSLRIYNVAGQPVRTLVDEVRAPGLTHQVTWRGRNDARQPVASGVYFYKLVTKDFTKTRKMVLLK